MGGVEKPVADGNAARGGARGTEGTTRVPPSANQTVGASGRNHGRPRLRLDGANRVGAGGGIDADRGMQAEGIDDCAARPPCPTDLLGPHDSGIRRRAGRAHPRGPKSLTLRRTRDDEATTAAIDALDAVQIFPLVRNSSAKSTGRVRVQE